MAMREKGVFTEFEVLNYVLIYLFIFINRIACGIIARSAGILQNFKKICACDGVTLWDERYKPLAGGTRAQKL